MNNAVEATGLGVRYRRSWALRDCSLAVPAGRVVALVGPNGAGKTTLLHAVVGLLSPDQGRLTTSGEVAFMAQDKPLYGDFRVAEMLRFGRRLNPSWDGEIATERLATLGIPLKRKVSTLSGGEQAQVALVMALAKRPELLVLDEPLVNLDPLARHDVMRALMTSVAERGLTVLISSHVVADLEDTCDWIVVLNRGRVQVSGDIESLRTEHLMLTGPVELADRLDATVIGASYTDRQATLLVRSAGTLDPRWIARQVTLDELVMGYLRSPEAAALPAPVVVQA